MQNRSFFQDESGQATVEYVLIVAAAVVGAAQMARQIISVLDKGVLRIGAVMEKDLKTGRAPLSVWSN